MTFKDAVRLVLANSDPFFILVVAGSMIATASMEITVKTTVIRYVTKNVCRLGFEAI
jgi:hypothetical protein